MTNTINNVSRELLERASNLAFQTRHYPLHEELRTLLSAPSPAGVGGLEVVGWYTEDHLDDKSATTYSREVADRWLAKGWPVNGIANAAAAQAIIDGLRARCFSLVMNCAAELETASYCMTDEEAKRIAQSGADYYRKEARLSAGKEGSDG